MSTPKTVVFVHGYSVRSLGAYGQLPTMLIDEGMQEADNNLYRCADGHERRSYAAFGVDVTGAPPMQSMVWCVEKMMTGRCARSVPSSWRP